MSLAAGEFSPEVGWELASLTLVLVWSSFQCFRALEIGDIDLPGRDAEFWLAAADSGNNRHFLAVTSKFSRNVIGPTAGQANGRRAQESKDLPSFK
jgi:hypothetical protein